MNKVLVSGNITRSLLYNWKYKTEEQLNSTVSSDEQPELLIPHKEIKFRYSPYYSQYPRKSIHNILKISNSSLYD